MARRLAGVVRLSVGQLDQRLAGLLPDLSNIYYGEQMRSYAAMYLTVPTHPLILLDKPLRQEPSDPASRQAWVTLQAIKS